MITYWYQIDPWNHIEGDDEGNIYSVTDVPAYLCSMGWRISDELWNNEENRLKRKRLADVFAQRNFFQYEKRLRHYAEDGYDGIFPI